MLPNELLQTDELAVENIINKFNTTVDAPVFSLPRHNSSQKLPDELPDDLVAARLVWVCRNAARAPLQRPYDSPFAVVARGPRAFTIRVGTRDEIIGVARLKPCTDVAAEPGSLRRHGRLLKAAAPGQIPAADLCDQAAPRRVTFSDPLVSSPSQ